MPVQPCLRRRCRVSLDEALIAVRKGHGEEVGLLLHPGDDHDRFAEVRLGMPRRMRQRHEHLSKATAPLPNVILDDGLPAVEAVLVAQPVEYPLRRVALLAVNRSVLFQYTVNDIGEGVELRALRRLTAPISRRHRVRQHLLHGISRNTKSTGCLSLAQPINMAPKSDSSIKLHGVHPPGPSIQKKDRRLDGGRVLLRPLPVHPAATVA